MKRALIDGDIIAYRFAFINEFDIDFGDEGEPSIITIAKAEEAMVDVDNFIQWILDTTGADEAVVCLSGKDNFRYKELEGYKDNRNASTVPTLVDVLKKYMTKTWNARTESKLEADDLMGLLQDSNSIICTIDKDLDQIEGMHFNWNKKEIYEIDELQARHFFYSQVLMGDSTDNIKGAPKIGKIKSVKILDKCIEDQLSDKEIWKEIEEIYKKQYKKYVDEDASDNFINKYLIANTRAVRILRGEEYDFTTKEIDYWI